MQPHPASRFHALLLLCALLPGLMALTGCHHFFSSAEPEPPDYLKVTGQSGLPSAAAPVVATEGSKGDSSAEESAPPADIPADKLEAQAMVSLDGAIPDPGQRLLLARAEARRAALRSLAQNLLALKDSKGQTLEDRLKNSPERVQAFNESLDTHAIVTFEEKRQITTAWVKVPWAGVQPFMSEQTAKAAKAAKEAKRANNIAQAPDDPARRQVFDQAVENARTKLKAELLLVALPDKRVIKDVLADNPRAMERLDSMVFLAQPDEVIYRDDGVCEATFYFDQNRVRELAAKAPKKTGHHWFGWVPFVGHKG